MEPPARGRRGRRQRGNRGWPHLVFPSSLSSVVRPCLHSGVRRGRGMVRTKKSARAAGSEAPRKLLGRMEVEPCANRKGAPATSGWKRARVHHRASPALLCGIGELGVAGVSEQCALHSFDSASVASLGSVVVIVKSHAPERDASYVLQIQVRQMRLHCSNHSFDSTHSARLFPADIAESQVAEHAACSNLHFRAHRVRSQNSD